ncbi:MAG TPA: GAF domain-containing protein [Candidatus Polarisedimenticolia bacterium]
MPRPGGVRRRPARSVKRSRQLRAFYRISRLGSTSRNPEGLGPRILREFTLALGFTRTEIWLVGPERGRMRMLCSHGQWYDPPVKRVNVKDCAFTMRLLRSRRGIHLTDACRSRAELAKWAPWEVVTSVFGAPLRARGRVIGTLLADRHGQRFDMSAADLELATVLATLLAEVIDSSFDRQARAKAHRQMRLLNRASRLIGTTERLEILLPRLARLIRQRACYHAVLVGLHDPGRREIEIVAAAAPDARRVRGLRLPAGRGAGQRCLAGRVLMQCKPIRIEDARELASVPSPWPLETRSLLVLPIRVSELPIGVLQLESVEPFAFDQSDVRVFSVLCEQIGHAVRRARVLATLQRKQAELRAVSENLEQALEGDRRRIARELHDELAQSMTAAKLNLSLLRDLVSTSRGSVRRLIGDIEAILDTTIGETRRISMDLRPAMLDELGLLPALRWYVGNFASRTGIHVALRARGAEVRMRREIETLLYRFVQEALTNVARHARARRVQINLLSARGQMKAVVSDNGVGIGERGNRTTGLGLLGMRERIERIGGELRIDSRQGGGTRLEASIPIDGSSLQRAVGPILKLAGEEGRMSRPRTAPRVAVPPEPHEVATVGSA